MLAERLVRNVSQSSPISFVADEVFAVQAGRLFGREANELDVEPERGGRGRAYRDRVSTVRYDC